VTVYLTAEQVLFIHYRLVSETGGGYGVRDIGLLESAIARPRATFDKHELYESVFDKAAALMESLTNNHPFIDGNKRTGIACTVLFLRQNNIIFSAKNSELERFTMRVASAKTTLSEIAKWLENHSSSSSASKDETR
jgi:death-on-curing protein